MVRKMEEFPVSPNFRIVKILVETKGEITVEPFIDLQWK